MKAALYMCGHGAYREPRILEIQYLRILRYCEALEDKLGVKIDIDGVYIDINFPRTEYVQGLTNLQRLVENIKNQRVNVVIVDICLGNSFQQNKYSPIIWYLEKAGAKVYNCFYDDEDALLSLLIKRYGKKVHSHSLPNDREEFVTLFPALAAEVTYEVLEDRLSRVSASNTDPFTNYVYNKIDSLQRKNPYNCSALPWLSDKTHMKLYKLREEELDERRLIEETYILAPEQKGKLLEEDIGMFRSQESFKWVFNRLQDLDFNHYINGKEHSFIMDYGDYILYADPRQEGAIEILIYKKKTEKRTKRNNINHPIGSFKMQDSWKNDLKVKLKSRIEDTIHRYEKRKRY